MHWRRRRVRFKEVLEKVPKVPEQVREALVQSHVTPNRLPEKVPGSLGVKPSQVQRVPEKVPEKVWEALVQSQVKFNRVPEKVPEKVWEALAQSQVRFNRVPEKVPEKVWKAWCSQVKFNRIPEKVPEKVPGSLGAQPSQVRRVPEKVAEAKRGQVHLIHGKSAEVFPALGFPTRFRKICKNTIKRRGCWGYHRSLFLQSSLFQHACSTSSLFPQHVMLYFSSPARSAPQQCCFTWQNSMAPY